jgi:putative membrane protein
MAEIHPADSADRFEVRVTADSHFGWIRTRLSLERTMMSWVRTATALIGFGFAIVQYLDRLQQLPDPRPAYFPNAPRSLGLALIGCGILALVVSLHQYWWTARYLSGGAFAPIARMKADGMLSPVVAIAVLLICIGLFAFFAVLFRVA